MSARPSTQSKHKHETPNRHQHAGCHPGDRQRICGSTLKSKSQSDAVKVQPLTYANVVSHFKAAHLRVTEVQKRCTIFFEGEFKSADVYNYGIIIVENSDEDVQVTFYLTDAHEMNWEPSFLIRHSLRAVKRKSFSALSIHNATLAVRKSDAFASIFIVGSHATRRSLSLVSRHFERRKFESRF